MTTEFTWLIEVMECKPQEGDLTDVVITAHWRCNGVDSSDSSFTGTAYGACGFSAPGDPFIPYDELTQDQVLGWCWENGVDKDAIESSVNQQIQNKINPPVIKPPLPWAS